MTDTDHGGPVDGGRPTSPTSVASATPDGHPATPDEQAATPEGQAVAADGPTGGGRLLVLSGPSGVGKTTVLRRLRQRAPHVWISVSATTRPPRPGEQDGVHYRFVDDDTFDAAVAAGEFLEWAAYAGRRYGTLRAPVEARLAAGQSALLEIEISGARQVRAAVPTATMLFLAPPDWPTLVDRLSARGTEAADVVAARLATARDELAAATEFDEVLVNDDVEAVVDRLLTWWGS
jgi:guanylate kinase